MKMLQKEKKKEVFVNKFFIFQLNQIELSSIGFFPLIK